MSRVDFASIVGLLIGVAAIIVGQTLEGGKLSAIIQPTAALIVLGGTLGATAVSFPLANVLSAAKAVKRAFKEEVTDPDALVKEIIGYATKARKSGLVSLELDIKGIKAPFLAKALRLAVDGMDPKLLAEAMEAEIDNSEERAVMDAKVYEAAGGYAPTIGIIGAVLGLIQVMANLSDPSKLGAGIAVAFVATIYGVGSANLFFLPMANKLKVKAKREVTTMLIMLEGVISIQSGLNPHYIEEKLKVFFPEGGGKAGKGAAASKVEAKDKAQAKK